MPSTMPLAGRWSFSCLSVQAPVSFRGSLPSTWSGTVVLAHPSSSAHTCRVSDALPRPQRRSAVNCQPRGLCPSSTEPPSLRSHHPKGVPHPVTIQGEEPGHLSPMPDGPNGPLSLQTCGSVGPLPGLQTGVSVTHSRIACGDQDAPSLDPLILKLC